MWRRYKDIKRIRWGKLITIWTKALKALIPEYQPDDKKAAKQAKHLQAKYMRVDRDGILKVHLKAAQRQYYVDIHNYINCSKAFRKGVKAFISTTLEKKKGVFFSGAPDFQYKLTVSQAQKLIIEASNNL